MSYNDEYPLLKDKFNVFRSATYDKVMEMFYKFKTGVVYIGGAWCKIVKQLYLYLIELRKKIK